MNLPVAALRRMVALGEHGLAPGRHLRELGGASNDANTLAPSCATALGQRVAAITRARRNLSLARARRSMVEGQEPSLDFGELGKPPSGALLD